jgi:hypothetical protein
MTRLAQAWYERYKDIICWSLGHELAWTQTAGVVGYCYRCARWRRK